MSMLKICGQELELDLFDADTMEVYEKSMDEVVKRAKESKKHTELSNADGIREMCGIVKNFFDEVFGDGTAEKLFKGKNNLAICMDAFGIVSSEAGKQFDEMMGKWGLDPEKDLDKIYRIPGGGFIQKKDHKHFHEVLDRHNAEMEAAKAADEDGTGFLYQMFKYELDNHEYGYTGDLEDTLDCLGLTWEELKASPVMLKALDKASTEIREREGC